MPLKSITIVYASTSRSPNVHIHQVSSPHPSDCVFFHRSLSIPAPGIYMGVRTSTNRSNGHSNRRSPSPDRRSHHRRHRHHDRSRFVLSLFLLFMNTLPFSSRSRSRTRSRSRSRSRRGKQCLATNSVSRSHCALGGERRRRSPGYA